MMASNVPHTKNWASTAKIYSCKYLVELFSMADTSFFLRNIASAVEKIVSYSFLCHQMSTFLSTNSKYVGNFTLKTRVCSSFVTFFTKFESASSSQIAPINVYFTWNVNKDWGNCWGRYRFKLRKRSAKTRTDSRNKTNQNEIFWKSLVFHIINLNGWIKLIYNKIDHN